MRSVSVKTIKLFLLDTIFPDGFYVGQATTIKDLSFFTFPAHLEG